MFRIRRVKTKSGSIAIQVVQYVNRRAKIIKHIGSARDAAEAEILNKKAAEWITEHESQTNLFPDAKARVLIVDRCECVGVNHRFAYDFFRHCLDECNLVDLPPLLLDFVIMRLIEPASKLRTIELLSRYFGIAYTQRIYRKLPKIVDYKGAIEAQAYAVATERFNEQFYYVLYDVTTLYFESFKADDLRVQGFSKDNKSQQPQIVIGLLVTQSGFPLSYDVFAGNTFEGKTMLPVVNNFMKKHPQSRPIVVADAAMLDEDRLRELREKNISYIVGARLSNANIGLVKQIHNKVRGVNGTVSRFESKHGNLICDYSEN